MSKRKINKIKRQLTENDATAHSQRLDRTRMSGVYAFRQRALDPIMLAYNTPVSPDNRAQ